jgi:hypothetical protein
MDYINSSVNSGEQTTELYVKKVLAGDIESVRLRLINSMESMGYDIIEEEPKIIGRRGAKSWATWFGSADVLDYPMTLTVRLKPLSTNSTRATFDYLIKHPMINKGEQAIVIQEAKTIASISKIQAVEKMCSVCETESTDDSRFCRRCGAPLTGEQAELEVLRLMAETRAGKTSVISAAVLASISTVLLILAIIFSATGVTDLKRLLILLGFGLTASLLATISAFFGSNRLRRALNKPIEEPKANVPQYIPETLETGDLEELPPRRPVASITEGTTNLLDEEWANNQKREKVPVSNRRETNNFD